MSNRRQISPKRQTMYYCGMGLSLLGTLMFLSVFVTIFANFGNFNFHPEQIFLVAFAGMVLAGLGNGIMRVAARGWSGSGIILDPEQAQRDVEPWSRMGGGIMNDALSEVDVLHHLKHPEAVAAQIVKIRCPHCQALNDEQAKFCNQCGGTV